MNLRLKTIALCALIIATCGECMAQLTATQAFSTVPRKVLPLFDDNARLDMIDYFNSNMSNTTENTYGGRSRITSLSPEQMTVKLTDASDCQIAILPDGKNGLIAMITTIASPTPDSRMSVYSSDWSRELTSSVFTKPVLSDWLTPEGKKNSATVETSVPFLLISYHYDPSTKILTLTNNTSEFLGKDVYEPLSGFLLDKIDYQFNGKRFNRVK
ncbi:MAG: DUF3256 family protein [Paramuribaculum sp.]|nr:DUF3256 family protein [Paramuribaculum sp.]MDE6488871.1 DUF3256 family protein [Paramuribaculum sp.]